MFGKKKYFNPKILINFKNFTFSRSLMVPTTNKGIYCGYNVPSMTNRINKNAKVLLSSTNAIKTVVKKGLS